MTKVEQYRTLNKKLTEICLKNEGEQSDEENQLLEQMDIVWWNMTPKERHMVERDSKSEDDKKADSLVSKKEKCL